MRRRRVENGEIRNDGFPSVGNFGINLPEIVESMEAHVCFDDVDDLSRIAAMGIYLGLSLGLKQHADGIDLQSPYLEHDL